MMITFNPAVTKQNLFGLLPYALDSKLIQPDDKLRLLQLLSQLTKVAKHALMDFSGRKYKHFDAQVGDTCCQVRAYYILLLTQEYQSPYSKLSINKEIEQLEAYSALVGGVTEQFESDLNNREPKYNQCLDKKETVHDFLCRCKLNLEISQNAFFLISSYFLSYFALRDASSYPVAINYSEVVRKFSVTKTVARKLAKHYQSVVARLSCDFIDTLLVNLTSFHYEKQALHALRHITEEKREVYPCYIGMKILIAHCQRQRLPILLKINLISRNQATTESLLFIYKNGCFKCADLTNAGDYETQEPCMVIEGYANSNTQFDNSADECLKQILSVGLQDILLANMAAHPQFSGVENANNQIFVDAVNRVVDISNTSNTQLTHDKNTYLQTINLAISCLGKEQQEMQAYAKTIGASKENPSLFFLQHVYCDKIGNVRLTITDVAVNEKTASNYHMAS